MEFTEKDLDNLSELARITIKPEEKGKMLQDMKAILVYVSEINSVSGDVVREKEIHYNIVREDVVTREVGAETEALLHEAPAVEDGFVKVSQVLK